VIYKEIVNNLSIITIIVLISMICSICGYRYGCFDVYDGIDDWMESISEFDSDEFGICPVCAEEVII